MDFFDVILKLIRVLGLVETPDFVQLNTDVKGWKDTATEDSDDKVKAAFARLHKGVIVKLFMPFVYFFLLKWVKDLTAPPQDDMFD